MELLSIELGKNIRLAGELDRVQAERRDLAERVARLETTIARMRNEGPTGG